MTDKQIIIDGVDVSGCELYRNDNGVFAPDGTAERTELCYLTNDYCGNNTNCYYKQLKRKEQECEELKEKCKKYGEINEQETKDYAELKAENERLKNCHLDSFIEINNAKIKYYTCLQEIKEIAEKHAPRCAVSCPNDEYKCEICMLDDLKLILRKINEVENENTRNI